MGDRLSRRDFLLYSAAGASALVAGKWLLGDETAAPPSASGPATGPARRPNIIFILADDLGYGDVGCFGQKLIKTPNLDRMAADGTRFTQAYCGTSVCAPSRCSLMTGLHMGHAPIRGNRELKPEGQMPLPAGSYTVAQLLKDAGYDTACIGKWGLGFFGGTGDPNRNGFDLFFGYNCQKRAHNYYPDYLWRNDRKVPLDGKTYSHDLMTKEALEWVGGRKEKPFFLYLAYTIPHTTLTVPELGEYADKDWKDDEKAYAAMVTRMDRDIGSLLDLLKKKGLERDTIVFFASDNGPMKGEGVFNSAAGLRGAKRGMGEGSLRTPMIVRWSGHVPEGKVRDEPWAFWDFLPTCAELAGAKVPAKVPVDGISVAQALQGKAMPQRECFYWELHEGPCKQAVRFGDWKAERSKPGEPLALYDLAADPREKSNLAGKKPDVVARADELMRKSRTESPDWPLDK